MQTAIRISRSPVQGGGHTPSVRVSRKGGAARKAAPTLCAPAFLTQKIADIRPAEQDGLSFFDIDIDSSFDYILKCCRRFCKFTKIQFGFEPNASMTKSQNLGLLIECMDKAVSQFGLDFFVSKKSPQGEELRVLTCAVYRVGHELEETIVIMYVSPARYLSPESAELFKRFMKFFSESTNIPLGIIGNRNNYYVDVLLSLHDDDPIFFEYLNDEELASYNDRKSIAAAYNEGGEFWNLFDEINSLPTQDAKKLADDIDSHFKDCPTNEVELMKCLLSGIDIVKDMNCFWFEFNPEDDGLPDAYGNVDGEGWASSVFASAILYSEQDGISERLLESINCDVSDGIVLSGWNIHQYLSPTVKKAYIDDFMRCRNNVGKFSNWLVEFHDKAQKFDKYGESE